jgi:hypothetical protein
MTYWSGGQPGIDLNITAAVIANLAAGAYEIYSRCITPFECAVAWHRDMFRTEISSYFLGMVGAASESLHVVGRRSK